MVILVHYRKYYSMCISQNQYEKILEYFPSLHPSLTDKNGITVAIAAIMPFLCSIFL